MLRTPSKARLSALFAAGCLLFLSATAGFSANDPEVTEQQLEALKSSISKLQHWLDSAKDKRSHIQSDLKKSELQISQTARKIKAVAGDIQQAQSKLKTLQSQRKTLLAARKQQEQYIARQIRAAYGIGRQEYLKVLLNQEQPDQLARALRYYDYFNQARAGQIEQYSATLQQLRVNEQAINQETTALQLSKQQLEQKRSALRDNKQKRQKILLRLEGTIKNKDQELEKLLANRKQLEQLLDAVEQTIAELKLPETAAPINQLKGRLPWPTKGKIVRRFGSTDRLARTRWNGMLIAASEGREVTAIHHGRVVFADWLRGFGLLIIIDHGHGYMSLYGHNQTLYRSPGDWVNPNEVIASVGNSGGQKQAGLYFEIRKDGKPQNPQQWILARR